LIHFEISGGTGAGILRTVLPVSACAEGLLFDAYLAEEPLRMALGDIVAPTRAISLKDDGFLTADAALHIAANEGVGFGTLATACLVLGELDRFARLLDPATDDTGVLMEREALPKRIVGKRKPTAGPSPEELGRSVADDEEGVGF